MLDFSTVTSLDAAKIACRNGLLIKALLFPEELGGQDRTDNVVYITMDASVKQKGAIVELLDAVRAGMKDVAVLPEYRGVSFVPASITITASRPGSSCEYERKIEIW